VPGWLPDNLGCVKGWDNGRIGCGEACGVETIICCLAARSRSRRFCCATDLAEDAISQTGWLPNNLGCVEGGGCGRFGCREACNTERPGPPFNISGWDSFRK
jgi:hypothetical protein